MIVVVGLAFEARIAVASGLRVICAGDGRQLEPTLDEAIATGCRGLISFGIAGGLADGLTSGTCIVASGVVSAAGLLPTDRLRSQALLQAMPGAVSGLLAGAPAPVASQEQKRALHRATGALAVDTESHVVAAAAARHRLPTTAVRVVCDPVTRTLPEVALRAVRPDGSTDVLTLLRALLRRPDNVTELLQIALEARLARAKLLQSCRLLGSDPGRTGADDLAALGAVQARLGPAMAEPCEARAFPKTARLLLGGF
jgi:hopanoid-associated phosphorylase